jgi:hypothetical protein
MISPSDVEGVTDNDPLAPLVMRILLNRYGIKGTAAM